MGGKLKEGKATKNYSVLCRILLTALTTKTMGEQDDKHQHSNRPLTQEFPLDPIAHDILRMLCELAIARPVP